MKKVIIIGATSGLGRELALHYINSGNIVGIAGRRGNLLEEIKSLNHSNVYTMELDSSKPEAKEKLNNLIEEMGGMDLFVYCSGTGYVNKELEIQKEIQTVEVNVYGFTQLINIAYHYFKEKGNGHIAAIASVSGIRTLSICPSYCASKRYNMMYLKALRQLSKKEKLNIKISTINPGFIKTALIQSRNYPLTTSLEKGGKLLYKAIEKGNKRSFIPSYWGLISYLIPLIPNFIWKKII
jgi:short-subunit dehydrogenase